MGVLLAPAPLLISETIQAVPLPPELPTLPDPPIQLYVIGFIAVLLVSVTVVEAGEITGSPLSMVIFTVAVDENPDSLAQRV